MSDVVRKAIMAGLGLVSISKAKADRIVNLLVKQGEISRTEGSKLVKDIMGKVEQNKMILEKRVESAVKQAMDKLDIPSRREVNDLRKKVEVLSKKLDKSSRRQS